MAVGNWEQTESITNIARAGDPCERSPASESQSGADVRATKLFKQVAPDVATRQAFLRLADDPAQIELVMVRSDGSAEIYPISTGLRAHFLNIISNAISHEFTRSYMSVKK